MDPRGRSDAWFPSVGRAGAVGYESFRRIGSGSEELVLPAWVPGAAWTNNSDSGATATGVLCDFHSCRSGRVTHDKLAGGLEHHDRFKDNLGREGARRERSAECVRLARADQSQVAEVPGGFPGRGPLR